MVVWEIRQKGENEFRRKLFYKYIDWFVENYTLEEETDGNGDNVYSDFYKAIKKRINGENEPAIMLGSIKWAFKKLKYDNSDYDYGFSEYIQKEKWNKSLLYSEPFIKSFDILHDLRNDGSHPVVVDSSEVQMQKSAFSNVINTFINAKKK